MPKTLLFTIDVEEFVLPAEAGLEFSNDAAFELGILGLRAIETLMERHEVRATLFATVAFAKRYQDDLRRLLRAGHELALHAVEHHHDYSAMPEDIALKWLSEGRRELCQRFRAPVLGFRANRFRAPKTERLHELGFRWTSNLHPTWVPGSYNNFRAPRVPHMVHGLREVPISVSPRLRLPVSWFWMRNFGWNYLRFVAKNASLGTDYLHLYVHPWEAAVLPRIRGLSWMGRLSIRRTGQPFLDLLDRLFTWSRARHMISRTISEHLEQGPGGSFA